MAKFTVETQFLVPVYRHKVYEAETVEAALAFASQDDDWYTEQKIDWDNSREDEHMGIWAGDEAYQGDNLMPTKPAERTHVRKYLDCSTNHLSWHTAKTLDGYGRENAVAQFDDREPRYVLTVASTGFGWTVAITEDRLANENGDIPADLHNVMKFAHAAGCDRIVFDRDADTIDELPTFDW